MKVINAGATELSQRVPKYLGLAFGYVVFAVALLLVIPGNPDPIPVPVDLLGQFRTLTIIGHFLQWMLLGAGVGLVLIWKQRSAGIPPEAAANSGASG